MSPGGSAAGWVADIYTLVGRGDPDAAIDALFRNVDALLLAGELQRCDELLSSLDLARLDANLLVGVLSITLGARDRLPGRARLVQRVADRLALLVPERAERLLVGLR